MRFYERLLLGYPEGIDELETSNNRGVYLGRVLNRKRAGTVEVNWRSLSRVLNTGHWRKNWNYY